VPRDSLGRQAVWPPAHFAGRTSPRVTWSLLRSSLRPVLTWTTLLKPSKVINKVGSGSMRGGMVGGSLRKGIMRSWRRIIL